LLCARGTYRTIEPPDASDVFERIDSIVLVCSEFVAVLGSMARRLSRNLSSGVP
jgi:hypothetical protein